MSYYIIETRFIDANSGDDKYVDEHYFDITIQAGRTNMSKEERVEGWLGTSNDWIRHAHGEYETVDAARTVLLTDLLDGDYRDISDEIDSSDREECGIIERYKPGRYCPWGAEATQNWVYDGIQEAITAETTDEQIEVLVEQYMEEGRREVDAELDSDAIQRMMEARRSQLRSH